jgi:hypothetical protein
MLTKLWMIVLSLEKVIGAELLLNLILHFHWRQISNSIFTRPFTAIVWLLATDLSRGSACILPSYLVVLNIFFLFIEIGVWPDNINFRVLSDKGFNDGVWTWHYGWSMTLTLWPGWPSGSMKAHTNCGAPSCVTNCCIVRCTWQHEGLLW